MNDVFIDTDNKFFIYNDILYDSNNINIILECIKKNIPICLYSSNRSSKTTYLNSFRNNNTYTQLCNIHNNIYRSNYFINKEIIGIPYYDYDIQYEKHIEKLTHIFSQASLNKDKHYILCIDNIHLFSIQVHILLRMMLDKYFFKQENCNPNISIICSLNNISKIPDTLKNRLCIISIEQFNEKQKYNYIQHYSKIHNIKMDNNVISELSSISQHILPTYLYQFRLFNKNSSVNYNQYKKIILDNNSKQLIIDILNNLESKNIMNDTNVTDILDSIELFYNKYNNINDFIYKFITIIKTIPFDNFKILKIDSKNKIFETILLLEKYVVYENGLMSNFIPIVVLNKLNNIISDERKLQIQNEVL